MKKLLLSITILVFVGCSSPKVDTSTYESMKSSLEKVRESLPEGKRDEFNEAVQLLINYNESHMKDLLNGKTGKEILREASALKER